MTPYDRADIRHLEFGSEWTFAEVIEAHAVSGHVHITPDVFVMARQVHSEWDPDSFSDPYATFSNGNCWHVWLLAGDFRAAMAFMPYPLPFISYHRRGRLRILTLDDALRMTKSR
jgi:hypothetical protein